MREFRVVHCSTDWSQLDERRRRPVTNGGISEDREGGEGLGGVGWAVEAVGCVGGEAATRRGTTSPGITDHLRIIGKKWVIYDVFQLFPSVLGIF